MTTPSILVHQRYDFINPKAGITYTHQGWQAFLSYSLASHEPSRDDFETGVNDQPRPEMLHRFFELSLAKKEQPLQLGSHRLLHALS